MNKRLFSCGIFIVVGSRKSEVGGGGLLGSIFAGYVPLASQSPYPIIVYFEANYSPKRKRSSAC